MTSLISRLENVQVPLDRSGRCDPEAKQLMRSQAQDLFPNARNPQAALAGLLLIAGCWEEAHQISQDLADAEGSYWHALVHRMEPETWNSDYWFGRVGSHAIFSELFETASGIIRQRHRVVGLKLQSQWQPSLFNSWCDRAREHRDPELTSVITEIHTAECWLLWQWCVGLKRK